MSAGRQRPAVAASQVQKGHIGARLVGEVAREVAGAVPMKRVDDVGAN